MNSLGKQNYTILQVNVDYHKNGYVTDLKRDPRLLMISYLREIVVVLLSIPCYVIFFMPAVVNL